jgi:hypothetical protein
MNWFDVLKNAGLAQRQRQGISARQKDEEFIFEDEDDEDCLKELKTYVSNVLNKFKPEFEINEWKEKHRTFVLEASTSTTKRPPKISKRFYIQQNIPDEIYCDLLNLLKKIDFDNSIHKIHNTKLNSIKNTHRFLDDFDINATYFKNDRFSYEGFEVFFYNNKVNREVASYFEQRRKNE